jgi:transcriptional regulator with XRE-family HTH domain
MDPIDIKYLLKKKGFTQARIAREYGCTISVVHLVIEGKRRSQGIEKMISGKLGLSVGKLFPEENLSNRHSFGQIEKAAIA